jgi:hypothetical protein
MTQKDDDGEKIASRLAKALRDAKTSPLFKRFAGQWLRKWREKSRKKK